MTIDKFTYNRLCSAFSPVPPEAGGIIGSVAGCVCAFVYDPGTPNLTRGCYTPNIDFLNQTIAQWYTQNITFCGIVHSHPSKQPMLSEADLFYIKTIMDSMPPHINALYFPVIIPGEGIFPYLAQRESAVILDTIIIKEN